MPRFTDDQNARLDVAHMVHAAALAAAEKALTAAYEAVYAEQDADYIQFTPAAKASHALYDLYYAAFNPAALAAARVALAAEVK